MHHVHYSGMMGSDATALTAVNMVVAGGLSVPQTQMSPGFTKQRSQEERISREWQLCGGECVVDVGGQRSESADWFVTP